MASGLMMMLVGAFVEVLGLGAVRFASTPISLEP